MSGSIEPDGLALPAPRMREEDVLVAVFSTDGTGWTKVYASPAWWRWAVTSSEWAEFAEGFARAGEQNVNAHLCRVVGKTTKRPAEWTLSSSRAPTTVRATKPTGAEPARRPAWSASGTSSSTALARTTRKAGSGSRKPAAPRRKRPGAPGKPR